MARGGGGGGGGGGFGGGGGGNGGGGGGGGGGNNNPPKKPQGINQWLDTQGTNKNWGQLNAKKQTKMAGLFKTPEAAGPPPEDNLTGPGTNAYNQSSTAVQAALGTLQQQGVGAPILPGQPLSSSNAGAANEWLNTRMQQEYQNFVSKRHSTPGMEGYTWTQHLQDKYGGEGMPGMGAYYRSEWSRESPRTRGYFEPVVGPGRVVVN